MAGVPLLRLPFLPQLEILNAVDTKDLFYLSLISERTKALVKCANRSIENVRIAFDEGKKLLITSEGVHLIKIQEGNDELAIHPVVLSYKAGAYHEMVHRLIQHLFTVFMKVEKVTVHLANVEKIDSIPVWNYIKDLESLLVSVPNRKLTPEELRVLFDEVKVSYFFTLLAPKEGFEYKKGLKHGRVILRLLQCTNMNAVITSKSSIIQMQCPFPPATELNRLLKAWIAGGSMENLRAFAIGNGDEAPAGFMEQVLDGITLVHTAGGIFEFQKVDGKLARVELVRKRFAFNLICQ